MNNQTISDLLDGKIDPVSLRESLTEKGRLQAWEPFLETHHIEPEREETINVTPLSHLAIHICIALIDPTGSNHAACSAFVRYFGAGNWQRILDLGDDELTERLISFGQRRPDNPSVFIAARASGDLPRTEAQLLASAETGRRTLLENTWHRNGIQNTWGDKVSQNILNRPMCSCIFCHKEMKAIPGNITQHQRSPKCKK